MQGLKKSKKSIDRQLKKKIIRYQAQSEKRAKDQEIAPLWRRYVDYLADEDKKNGMSIIAKNNEEAEYPYISICR